MEVIETGINTQIGNPARSFQHRIREPFECPVVVAEGRMDGAQFVREQAFCSFATAGDPSRRQALRADLAELLAHDPDLPP